MSAPLATEEQVTDWHCMCGMALQHPSEYHPYAACLMFMACRNGDTVRANLNAVVTYGFNNALEAQKESHGH